ncbi:MAG: DNA-binding response regulator [Legionellales bacterium]|nr:DNA-binding response regulator [Legionellales bacterium]
MRILLAEDDLDLGQSLKEGLEIHGYRIDWVQDGQFALTALQTTSEHFDLAILDINMPKLSGLEVLKKIRDAQNALPVIILTAKDEIDHRVKGLDCGADDYIVKPFDLNELCARIRSIARRSAERIDPILRLGDLALDPAKYLVNIKEDSITFSRREFALLQKLMEKPGNVISRDVLSQTLYGWGDDVDSNTIEVHIHNLRKKIGDAAHIRTLRGIGYLIEDTKK